MASTATETARAAFRKISDRLDDALEGYVYDNGSDSRHQADEYREEGYALAEAAFDMPEEDREDWIDGETFAFPANARYLIAWAASYRLAELVARDAYPFIATTPADGVAA